MGAYRDALVQYNSTCTELASLQLERGDLRRESIRLWREGWLSAGPEGVTIRRESAKLAASGQEQEIARLDGEVEAALTRLRYLDQYIAYLQNQKITEQEGDG